jgi:hypothetical protein
MMKFLIEGGYDEEKGIYVSFSGKEKYYRATDNIVDPKFIGMGSEDLIDVAVFNDLHFNTLQQRGVAFHMIGPLCQFGKVGITCIGDTHEETEALHQKTLQVLQRETTPEGRAERLKHYMVDPQNQPELYLD